MPILAKFGIDLMHSGLVMVVSLMLGGLTPPFGMLPFVVARGGNVAFDRLSKIGHRRRHAEREGHGDR